MSIVNGDGGLVLTKKEISSPARTLVREQYPSTHGHRYFVAGSTRVLVNIQSRVPGRWFSRTIDMAALPFRPRVSGPSIIKYNRRQHDSDSQEGGRKHGGPPPGGSRAGDGPCRRDGIGARCHRRLPAHAPPRAAAAAATGGRRRPH